MRELLRRISAGFANLSPRERILLSGAGIALLVAVLYAGIVVPSLGARERVAQRLEAAEQQLAAMQRLRRDFDDVHGRLSSVENRIVKGQRLNLRTTLEALASRAGVKVESMEPQASPSNDRYRETKVEVGMAAVSLPETVSYLHQIESADHVLSIKALRIKTRHDRPELLDVTFTVSAFERL